MTDESVPIAGRPECIENQASKSRDDNNGTKKRKKNGNKK